MAGRVFFAPVGKDGKLPAGAIGRLFAAAGLGECFRPKGLVALKLHFGEPGNRDVWRPEQVREVVAAVKAGNALPFLTDANVLYRSLRHNAVEHLMVAHGNGFSYESCGAPLNRTFRLKKCTPAHRSMRQRWRAWVKCWSRSARSSRNNTRVTKPFRHPPKPACKANLR